jgi:uncharacterized phage-associated protein
MGIREPDFQAWRHHPVSKLLFRYLNDFRDVAIQAHLEKWENGTDDAATENMRRGFVNALREIAELQFGAVEAFYQREDPNETQAFEDERS